MINKLIKELEQIKARIDINEILYSALRKELQKTMVKEKLDKVEGVNYTIGYSMRPSYSLTKDKKKLKKAIKMKLVTIKKSYKLIDNEQAVAEGFATKSEKGVLTMRKKKNDK